MNESSWIFEVNFQCKYLSINSKENAYKLFKAYSNNVKNVYCFSHAKLFIVGYPPQSILQMYVAMEKCQGCKLGSRTQDLQHHVM